MNIMKPRRSFHSQIAVVTFLIIFLTSCNHVERNQTQPAPAQIGTEIHPESTKTEPIYPNATNRREPIVPEFSHILLIILENKEYTSVILNSEMPQLNQLAREYTLLTQYFAVAHPSLPNYIAMVSGDTFGIKSDCTNCFINAENLAGLLEQGGYTWKTYQENLPSPCFVFPQFWGKITGYAQKHNPFVYFDAIRNDKEYCKQSVVSLEQLSVDLENDQLPDFAFISPNLCHSGHDCDLSVVDNWLSNLVDRIRNSQNFDKNSLIVITYDEGESNLGCCSQTSIGGGRVATVLISTRAKIAYQDDTPYSHYSLLKTIAASWSLPELGHAGDTDIKVIAAPWK
jgi:hypothetical protein